MTTFGSLTTRVKAELIDVPNRTDQQVASFVNQAIRKLQFRHDFSVQRVTTAILTTAPGTFTLAPVPADFLRFEKVPPHVITHDGRIYDLGVASSSFSAGREFGSFSGDIDPPSGPPQVIAISTPTSISNARDFTVFPHSDGNSLYTTAPAGEYRIRIPYIRLLPTLVGDSDTNWFTENAEEFIIYAACSVGFFFNQDEQRGGLWQERAKAEVQDILARDKNESIGGHTTLDIHFDALGPRVPFGDSGYYRGYF